MSQVLLFTSLKGGVGKTTACAALAYALSFYGKRVLCVDLDFGVRGLDLALGAENTCGADVLEVIEGALSPRQSAMQLGPTLWFLPSPALLSRGDVTPPDEGQLSDFLAACKAQFDFVLLDLPAGGGELFVPLASQPDVDHALIVSTASASALRAAEQTGFELRRAGTPRVSLLLNRLTRVQLSRGDALFEMARAAALPVIGVIPEDECAALAHSTGTPLSRFVASPAGRAFWNVASRLLGGAPPLLDGVLSPAARRRLY